MVGVTTNQVFWSVTRRFVRWDVPSRSNNHTAHQLTAGQSSIVDSTLADKLHCLPVSGSSTVAAIPECGCRPAAILYEASWSISLANSAPRRSRGYVQRYSYRLSTLLCKLTEPNNSKWVDSMIVSSNHVSRPYLFDASEL